MERISFAKIKHLVHHVTFPKFFSNGINPPTPGGGGAGTSLAGARLGRAQALASRVPVRTETGPREVNFEFYETHAQAIALAGSFNNWNPRATPMRNTGKGKWVASLRLAPGRYEYRFVVDGRWKEDPLARETVPNPFGGVNSVVTV